MNIDYNDSMPPPLTLRDLALIVLVFAGLCFVLGDPALPGIAAAIVGIAAARRKKQ